MWAYGSLLIYSSHCLLIFIRSRTVGRSDKLFGIKLYFFVVVWCYFIVIIKSSSEPFIFVFRKSSSSGGLGLGIRAISPVWLITITPSDQVVRHICNSKDRDKLQNDIHRVTDWASEWLLKTDSILHSRDLYSIFSSAKHKLLICGSKLIWGLPLTLKSECVIKLSNMRIDHVTFSASHKLHLLIRESAYYCDPQMCIDYWENRASNSKQSCFFYRLQLMVPDWWGMLLLRSTNEYYACVVGAGCALGWITWSGPFSYLWLVRQCPINYRELVSISSVLFFSHPRSEGWPHHGRTFSIYPCPLSFWLTLPRGVLSTSWCCPPRPCVAFLAYVHLVLFLALSLSPGNYY